MLATPSGMMIELSDEQSAKAQRPMHVTELGMMMWAKEEQP